MSPRRATILAGLVVGGCAAAAAAAGPADDPVLTRWSRDGVPDRPLPEHPRPQLVRRHWESLNGAWEYAVRPAAETSPPVAFDGMIRVPYAPATALSGVGRPLAADEALWYRRRFTPPPRSGQRWFLHLEAVAGHATFRLNGVPLGAPPGGHRGGPGPLGFDVSDALRPGMQELIVRVTGPAPSPGIWQTVWLERRPDAHVTRLVYDADVDATAMNVTVESTAPGFAGLEAFADGEVVARAAGRAGEPLRLVLERRRLWSPFDPFVYELRVTFMAGQSRDVVRSYFGLRKVEVRPDGEGVTRIFLNDRPLFLHGVLDRGWWPDGGATAPSDEALRDDIDVARRLGFLMIHKRGKVEPDRWYAWCDRLGMLIWQDLPAIPEAAEAIGAPALAAAIDGRVNHPCIIGWGPLDGPAPDVGIVRRLDPTRLTAADVRAVRALPGPAMPDPEPGRASVLAAYGGLELAVPGSAPATGDREDGPGGPGSREAATDAFVALVESLRPLIDRGLSAAVYVRARDGATGADGLATFDRDVVRIDEARAKAAARLLRRADEDGP